MKGEHYFRQLDQEFERKASARVVVRTAVDIANGWAKKYGHDNCINVNANFDTMTALWTIRCDDCGIYGRFSSAGAALLVGKSLSDDPKDKPCRCPMLHGGHINHIDTCEDRPSRRGK